MKNTGFTLIELLVVIAILIILISLFLTKLFGIQTNAQKTACAKNIKVLTQTLCLYTSESEGYLRKFTPSTPATTVYGALFKRDGWNDLKNLICPSAENQTLPTSQGYGNPLKLATGAVLDYWIVFSGNLAPTELNTLTVPATNTLIIEKFNSDTDTWDSSCNHKTGGNIGRINGSAEFLMAIPSNKNTSGTTVSIKDESCAK